MRTFWFGNIAFSKAMGIIAPETSASIEHPVQVFLSNLFNKKFLHAIAVKGVAEGLALFVAHRQELITREPIVRPAFYAQHHIQSVASIGPSDLLAIQDRQLIRKKSPGQLNAKVGRKL